VGLKHKSSLAQGLVVIPDQLLRSRDLRETYTSLERITQLQERVGRERRRMGEEETATFEAQKGKMETFQWITAVEIAVICLLGGYQYFKLREIIEEKQQC
jgi:DNA-binding protein H-NS